jgi:hypothetical protein
MAGFEVIIEALSREALRQVASAVGRTLLTGGLAICQVALRCSL